MGQYEYWVHGVNVQIEYPDKVVGKTVGDCTGIRRSGWGTLVHQEANTSNWFHFAIPTPVIVNSQGIFLRYVRLRAEINETARIDMIHIRHDNRIILSQETNITNCSVDETFQSPKKTIRKGLALCVHISFMPGDDRGMVIFKGAGGAFSLET